MRIWLSAPRILGGLLRPGISFNLNELRRKAPRPARLSTAERRDLADGLIEAATARGDSMTSEQAGAMIDRAEHEIDLAAYVLTDWPVMQALTPAASLQVLASTLQHHRVKLIQQLVEFYKHLAGVGCRFAHRFQMFKLGEPPAKGFDKCLGRVGANVESHRRSSAGIPY